VLYYQPRQLVFSRLVIKYLPGISWHLDFLQLPSAPDVLRRTRRQ